ncbi:hypothetical protein FISHEDRAFT_56714 [Fistulina hepatica ATCC 64428]|uniref:Uncharacterized protein n=1 Tax=Fistulina hepatica ATCC 64428 TaxID=1128425 RepID=A0A0D7AHS1_9AGAR|nr:hypothetical protein FISHEDRAFT_56714 [Fistulina hepatica ATCC 64428]
MAGNGLPKRCPPTRAMKKLLISTEMVAQTDVVQEASEGVTSPVPAMKQADKVRAVSEAAERREAIAQPPMFTPDAGEGVPGAQEQRSHDSGEEFHDDSEGNMSADDESDLDGVEIKKPTKKRKDVSARAQDVIAQIAEHTQVVGKFRVVSSKHKAEFQEISEPEDNGNRLLGNDKTSLGLPSGTLACRYLKEKTSVQVRVRCDTPGSDDVGLKNTVKIEDPQSGSDLSMTTTVIRRRRRDAAGTSMIRARVRPTNNSLPFAQVSEAMTIWHTKFIPTVYTIIALDKNPWQFSTKQTFIDELQDLFDDLFAEWSPQVRLTAQHGVYRLICQRVYEWHGNLGNFARKIIKKWFEYEEDGVQFFTISEDIAAWVSENVAPSQSKEDPGFLWRYNDSKKLTGFYRSFTFSYIYAYSLHAEYHSIYSFEDPPIGAMALAAVAGKRALKAWQSGKEDHGKVGGTSSFSVANWGEATRKYAQEIKKLPSEQLQKICDAAKEVLSDIEQNWRKPGLPSYASVDGSRNVSDGMDLVSDASSHSSIVYNDSDED